MNRSRGSGFYEKYIAKAKTDIQAEEDRLIIEILDEIAASICFLCKKKFPNLKDHIREMHEEYLEIYEIMEE